MSAFFVNTNANPPTRFDMSIFMAYSDNYDPLTSEFLRQVVDIQSSGNYTVATEASRPDLLSFNIYGDTQYWWILLFYNGITAVEDLVTGMVINVPAISDLESLYFALTVSANAS